MVSVCLQHQKLPTHRPAGQLAGARLGVYISLRQLRPGATDARHRLTFSHNPAAVSTQADWQGHTQEFASAYTSSDLKRLMDAEVEPQLQQQSDLSEFYSCQ